MVFSHLLRFPFLVDLSRPELLLKHTRNLYLATEEGVSVGVWHTLPASQWEEAVGKSPEWHQETLGDGAPVVIYLHGNVGSRALSHRVQLVKTLSAAGCHVLSLDYSGFGDSTGEPSEAGLTSDALHLHNWVKHGAGAGAGPLLLWGHSLGSGVATNAAVQLQRQGVAIDALILEAPYTRIGEVVVQHRLSQLYMFLPGFEQLLWSILEKNNIKFANDENLKLLSCPLLILHSEDDAVVPHHMGVKVGEVTSRPEPHGGRLLTVSPPAAPDRRGGQGSSERQRAGPDGLLRVRPGTFSQQHLQRPAAGRRGHDVSAEPEVSHPAEPHRTHDPCWFC